MRLSNQEGLDLLLEYKTTGSIIARNKIVVSFLGVIKKKAEILSRNRDIKNDLVGEGVLGLIRALDNFDLSTGYSIGTYADTCIYGSMQSYLKKLMKKMTYKKNGEDFSYLINRLRKEYSPDMTHLDIVAFCNKYGVKYEDVIANIGCIYVDNTFSEMETRAHESPEKQAIVSELEDFIEEHLNTLKPQTKEILVAGVFGERGDLGKVAEVRRLTKSWTSQIHLQAKKDLQDALKDYV